MAKTGFQEPSGKMDVYITAESVITGDLQTKSNIKIDGRVTGSVNATGNVHVGSNAIVEGNISGIDVQIAGNVDGNVSAMGGLLLYGSAKLTGDVNAASMEVEKGALYKGSMVIGEQQKQAEAAAEPAPKETEKPAAAKPASGKK
jgi:cytoskeletal protein CcmA (bactofilin family)